MQLLEEAREESLRQHQRMQIEMKKQRAFIVESMEVAKRKKDWSKARDIVNMALTSVCAASYNVRNAVAVACWC